MVDLTEFIRESSSTDCKVCAALVTLPEDKSVKLLAALKEPKERIGHTAITTVLGKWGLSVSEAAIRRHRRHHV